MQQEAIVCLAIIIGTAIFSFRAFSNPELVRKYLFDSQAILVDKEYYRLFSSAVLHGSLMHLAFNMYALYSFGSAIELSCGWGKFLIIYIAGILGGNILALILHRNHEYRALGASGGVCGVIYACIFLMPDSSVQFMFIPFDIPAHIFAVVYLAFTIIGIRSQAGNIGHDAHLGGAINRPACRYRDVPIFGNSKSIDVRIGGRNDNRGIDLALRSPAIFTGTSL